MRVSPLFTGLILGPMLLTSAAVLAQSADPAEEEIILDKVSVRGAYDARSADTQIQPEFSLNEEEIASYGAGSLAELLEELGPQISSGRGRGSEAPVILVDGVRIASFREIRNFPPEAIQRVDVLPEEAALKYGYGANQRVINFVLKENFSAWTVEAELGGPLEGAGLKTENDAGYLKILKGTRSAFDAELQTNAGILEADRAVTNEQSDEPGWKDSLTARSETLSLGTSHFRGFGQDLRLTLSGDVELGTTLQYLGLAEAEFILPATSPFSETGEDVAFSRVFGLPGPLERESETRSANLNMTWTGYLGSWDMTSATSLGRVETSTLTDLTPDVVAFQAALSSLTAPVGPQANLSRYLLRRTEDAERISNTVSTNLLAKGRVLALPAGDVSASVSLDLSHSDRMSETRIGGLVTVSDLERQIGKLQVSGDVPLISSDMGVPGVESLGVNLTASASEYSDFGALYGFDGTLIWSPVEQLSFLGSYSYERGAPSVSQLGDTISVTQNVDVFDFVRGESVLVTTTSGGNPDLQADTRKTFKLSGELKPFEETDVRLRLEYIDTQIEDPIGSFNSVDGAIQAVFPDRFIRNAEGELIALDTRAVNFSEDTQRQIRSSLDWSKSLAPSRSGPARPAGGPGNGAGSLPVRQRPAASSGPGDAKPDTPPAPKPDGAPSQAQTRSGPSAGGPPGGGGPGGGSRGPRGGRVDASLVHTWTLESTRTLADGFPVQDFLNGASAGGTGGTPEHQLSFRTGYFQNGRGIRFSVDWQSGTEVLSDGANGALSFSDLTTAQLRLFYSVQPGSYLARKSAWFEGTRFSLDFSNILDESLTVRDATGVIPLRYEADRLDPEGRGIEISFRKHF